MREAFAGARLEQRVSWVLEAARALGAAHAAGVIHRDLKPENVLIDADGRVKVVDFGLASAVGLERMTQTGALVGTPTYMAPEQIAGRGRREPDARTDVWALGVLLFGPDRGAPLRRPDVARPRRRDHLGLVPRAVLARRGRLALSDAVVARALQVDPERRFSDARGFARALDSATASADPSARPPWILAGVALGLGILGLAGVVLAVGLRGAAAPSARPRPRPSSSSDRPRPPSTPRCSWKAGSRPPRRRCG
ncbi:MAG: protein kinase [Planctomycetota bacterium]